MQATGTPSAALTLSTSLKLNGLFKAADRTAIALQAMGFFERTDPIPPQSMRRPEQPDRPAAQRYGGPRFPICVAKMF
jgi:hypothetical protein